MKFNGESESHDGMYLMKEKVDALAALFVKRVKQKCEMNGKKIGKRAKLEIVEEVDIEASAEKIHALYIKVCDKNDIPKDKRLNICIPKATAKEMLQRKNRKLNPYKYLNEDDDASVDAAMPDAEMKNEDSENGKMEMNESAVSVAESVQYEYEQKCDRNDHVDKYAEDAFQGGLACSYWTPAHIRLPCKMVIKEVLCCLQSLCTF